MQFEELIGEVQLEANELRKLDVKAVSNSFLQSNMDYAWELHEEGSSISEIVDLLTELEQI